MIIDFSYLKNKNIEFSKGYILKGRFYRCSYITYNTLYENYEKGTEKVQLYNFEPKSKTLASVLILHGMGTRNIKFMLWLGTHLSSVGVNSTILILPGNYTRVNNGSVSGRSYLWPDMNIMYKFWEHAVVDVRTTIDLLQEQKIWKENNCLVGYCLGGMIGSIAATLDSRINQTIFMTTGGYIPNIIYESPVTSFMRKLLSEGMGKEFNLNNKNALYEIYEKQYPLIKNMGLIEITKRRDIHPLFRIDPIAYAHLLDKSKITFIDALFDSILPLKSRRRLFKEMKGAKRYIIPMTHASWLPFESFLAQYILFRVNINDKNSLNMVLKKQKLSDYISENLISKL